VIALIQVADTYQLALFAGHIFHDARVAEPCWAMMEFIDGPEGWIEYRCIDELGYRTKGGTNKRLPIPAVMMQALTLVTKGRAGGPIILKRRLAVGIARLPEHRRTFQDLVKTVEQQSPANWSHRVRAGIAGLIQAGGIDGDTVRREFARMVRRAGLRGELGPKSLRHHFATALERADVPYYTRKYLLGHTASSRGHHGNDPTAVYTHLDADLIKAGYQRLLDGPLAKVVEAFAARLDELGRSGLGRRPELPEK
jgi:integrase